MLMLLQSSSRYIPSPLILSRCDDVPNTAAYLPLVCVTSVSLLIVGFWTAGLVFRNGSGRISLWNTSPVHKKLNIRSGTDVPQTEGKHAALLGTYHSKLP